MNEEVYTSALRNALAEIKNVCPDINKPLILTNKGTLITADDQAVDPNMERAVSSLQDLAEKTSSAGGLEGLLIDAENGKIYVSRLDGMYFITALSKQADLTFLRTITGVVLPTVLKVLDNIPLEAPSPTPLKPTLSFPTTPFELTPAKPLAEEKQIEENVEQVEEPTGSPEAPETLEIERETEIEPEPPGRSAVLPSQQLIVDKFSGLMVRSDTVQIDPGILQRWTSMLNVEEIREVDVETFSGKTARCKTKVISDQRLEGRGLIRIPEKMCDTLEVKRGELVKVKPVIQESN